MQTTIKEAKQLVRLCPKRKTYGKCSLCNRVDWCTYAITLAKAYSSKQQRNYHENKYQDACNTGAE